MITPEFTRYIRQKLLAGFSKQDIARAAMKNGWTAEDLQEGFDVITKNSSIDNPLPLTRETIKTTPPRTGKKITLSLGLILASVIYAFYQNTIPVSSVTINNKSTNDSSKKSLALKNTPSSNTSTTEPSGTISPIKVTKNPKKISQIAKTSVPIPPPVISKPLGQYIDGTYAGDPADAYYGTIQVEAIVRNGVLADVQFLQHPNDRNTSIRINNYAMPILRQEAISAQSGNVDTVSGATDSSQAFQQSMSSALAQANN